MVQSVILEKLEALPEALQTEVLHYIDFLLERHVKGELKHSHISSRISQSLTEEEAEKQYGYGSMAGQITMADDFDEPLEDLAEYM